MSLLQFICLIHTSGLLVFVNLSKCEKCSYFPIITEWKKCSRNKILQNKSTVFSFYLICVCVCASDREREERAREKENLLSKLVRHSWSGAFKTFILSLARKMLCDWKLLISKSQFWKSTDSNSINSNICGIKHIFFSFICFCPEIKCAIPPNFLFLNLAVQNKKRDVQPCSQPAVCKTDMTAQNSVIIREFFWTCLHGYSVPKQKDCNVNHVWQRDTQICHLYLHMWNLNWDKMVI